MRRRKKTRKAKPKHENGSSDEGDEESRGMGGKRKSKKRKLSKGGKAKRRRMNSEASSGSSDEEGIEGRDERRRTKRKIEAADNLSSESQDESKACSRVSGDHGKEWGGVRGPDESSEKERRSEERRDIRGRCSTCLLYTSPSPRDA